MQTRIMRARGIAAVGLLTALASAGALAETPNTPRPETSLLGVRLLATYNDVLGKFGQPNEIQVGDPIVSGQGQLAATNNATGGGGLPGMGGRQMGSGMPPGMGSGYPGMGGRQMGSGMPPGMSGGYPGMGGRQMGSGMPPGMGSGMPPGMGSGYPGMSGSPMGGIPGMGSGRGLPGLGGGPMGSGGGSGYPGMGGPGMAAAGNTVEESGETTWWYHYPRQGLHYSFLFNKEGRVIQIQAYGQKPAPKIVAPRSQQGITLGSDLGQVIRKYGWSNDGEHSGDYVVMRYGQLDRIAFQSRHNKVLGIVLGRINPNAPNGGAPPVGGYPGGGYPGGAGGYPGGPGGYSGKGGGGGDD